MSNDCTKHGKNTMVYFPEHTKCPACLLKEKLIKLHALTGDEEVACQHNFEPGTDRRCIKCQEVIP